LLENIDINIDVIDYAPNINPISNYEIFFSSIRYRGKNGAGIN